MRHATPLVAAFAIAVLGTCVPTARAQVGQIPAFFGGGNNAAFDPEIDIVESGAKLDVQATVSADRKYVTMTARPQLANLVAIREFTFQTGGPRGIVGLPQPRAPNPVNQNADRNPRGAGARADKAAAEKAAPPATAPAAPRAAAPSVLEREGMFRIVFQPGQ